MATEPTEAAMREEWVPPSFMPVLTHLKCPSGGYGFTDQQWAKKLALAGIHGVDWLGWLEDSGVTQNVIADAIIEMCHRFDVALDAARQAERERCAKVADEHASARLQIAASCGQRGKTHRGDVQHGKYVMAAQLAAAIRALREAGE